MAKSHFYRSRIRPILTWSGEVYRLNDYIEFKKFVKQTPETIFSQHYSLFKNQTGVYCFSSNGVVLYIGYSQDLENRVLKSYFNHAFGRDNVLFQYILCDNQQQAMEIELFYIKTLKPLYNISGRYKKNEVVNIIQAPKFCSPIKLSFWEYWIKDNSPQS